MGSTPLFRINASGEPERLGALVRPGGAFRLEAATELPRWMLGAEGRGEFPDLPFWLEDLRPQGFLGGIAIGGDPERLTSTQILDHLMREGSNLPGDLLVGEQALDRFMRAKPKLTDPGDFDALADCANAGEGLPGGALVGGAHPKFCAYTERGAAVVKFASDHRMRDLLISEHLALATLVEAGIPAAQTRVHLSERYTHLESARFDRVGEHGRLLVVSLKALDIEYAGVGHGWPAIMAALEKSYLVTAAEVQQAELLNTFGMLIENTDRHAGNLSLMPDATGRLMLAPTYDMLPMRYALYAGDLTNPPALQMPAGEGTPAWGRAVELAHQFWSRVQDDERISEPFRALAHVRVGEFEQVMDVEAPRPA